MIVALVAAAVVGSAAAINESAVIDDDRVPFWVLVLAFALVEAFPIHVRFRSEASSFSLFEVALVVGVLLADPSAVLGAVALGSVTVLALVRRQPFPKLVFNGANQILQASLTVILFETFIGSIDPFSPLGSLLALSAAVVASAQGIVAIAAVIVAAEGRANLAKLLNTFFFGATVAAANTSMALIASLTIIRDPRAIGLLAVPVAVVFGSYRAYVAERFQRERVEFLYSSTRSLQATDPEEGIRIFLAEISTMFRAGRVDLLLNPTVDSQDGATRYSLDASGEVKSTSAAALDRIHSEALESAGHAMLIKSDTLGPLGAFVREGGAREAMVAVLRSESRVFGLLMAADPVGAIGSFSGTDLRLFETLSTHAATVLANDRLEQVLIRQRALERELSHQANHDSLTALPNRSFLRRELDRLLAESVGLQLLFIDLDDFKMINDTYGHAGGDQLLVTVAGRIQSCLHPGDLAARLGGDEFAVLLHGTDRGARIAKQIIMSVQDPMVLSGQPVRVGCSIGVARAEGTVDADELLRQADTAMYNAKYAGKGNVAEYSESGIRMDSPASGLSKRVQPHDEVHWDDILMARGPLRG